ncbi:hypothetical protein [Mycobacterium sp. SMC-2]|uniref:hypothetical protein n=1 Tax=Mycobacterium sp. SMC-2 TaxID=2857058 RepID=UPI0028C38313|nr:hypothetical protein [Mycobacterium sp. SMC-2]
MRQETDFRTRPMVLVGGRPVLWHVMKVLNQHDISKFVVCTSYKDEYVDNYFSNYDSNVSIWSTHDRFFQGRKLGTDVSNGVFIPEYASLDATFVLQYRSARALAARYKVLDRLLFPDLSGPVLLEVFAYADQAGEPLVASRPNAQGEFVSPSLANIDPPIDAIHV